MMRFRFGTEKVFEHKRRGRFAISCSKGGSRFLRDVGCIRRFFLLVGDGHIRQVPVARKISMEFHIWRFSDPRAFSLSRKATFMDKIHPRFFPVGDFRRRVSFSFIRCLSWKRSVVFCVQYTVNDPAKLVYV